MSKYNSDVSGDSLIEGILFELKRRGASSDIIDRTKKLLSNEESKNKILEVTRIDKLKIEKATELKKRMQNLATEIIGLRYNVNEASKIMSKRLFEDNTETSRISNKLTRRTVTNQDELHLFIDDLHKYIVQSGNWNKYKLFDSPQIKPCLRIIISYRNSFDHIYDMKESGKGTDKVYNELGKINLDLLGHKVIKIEEYPLLQIEILERIQKMLILLYKDIEDKLK